MAAAAELPKTIGETLSPYAEIRKNAEAHLHQAQKVAGHALEVLHLIASNEVDAATRQAASVYFKNIIKKGWADDESGIALPLQERNTIKGHLVQLMCTVPREIQKQLSESIALIAKSDYHHDWQNLLPELVQQTQSPDLTVVVGVLKTADAIFKNFRFVDRNDELYAKIAYTLEGMQEPLLALFKSTGQAVLASAQDKARLVLCVEALRLMCRIFYSLNYQDLPAYFEDHMGEWMTEFAKYLTYKNSLLVDEDEEYEPSPVDALQAAILENLRLYTDKDEEAFMEYLPNFTSLVWQLLMEMTPLPKHDVLATTAMGFLSSLVAKQMHQHVFANEATLRQIVGNIVITNLTFRESDEEKFEDDPQEFIQTEVEGSDSVSRRRCAQNLLRAMCRQFETQTTQICAEHVETLLRQYAGDMNAQWRAKDAAIHLMMGISVRAETKSGVSQVNDNVNVMDFFQQSILPELQDANHSSRPVVKATSIKFVSLFRNQFGKDALVQVMPMLIAHLSSRVIVVHTFAAYAIERILVQKQVGGAELKPMLEPLFTGLFAIVDNTENNENDYVMKCVMRSLATVGPDVKPVTQIVISKLTAALGRAAKNPRNPQFNHYLFESIAVLVKYVCSADTSAVESFEAMLFEPFNVVLQMDIVEFTPYVFQILAQLLEFRPSGSGLGQAYGQLFRPLLTPSLWEKRGNVPALARLLHAYIHQSAVELVDNVDQILGVFQLLLSVTLMEASAFDILSAATVYFPHDTMDAKFATVFQLVVNRLQVKKTPRLTHQVTQYFALFVGKFGPAALMKYVDSLQKNLTVLLVEKVWAPQISSDPPRFHSEAKAQVVGLTRLLCETPGIMDNVPVAGQLLPGLVKILSTDTFTNETKRGDAAVDDGDIEIAYDAQYSQLHFAHKKPTDFFADVYNPTQFCVRALRGVNAASLQAVAQYGNDPEVLAELNTLLSSVSA